VQQRDDAPDPPSLTHLRVTLSGLAAHLEEARLVAAMLRPERGMASLARCLRSASDTLAVAVGLVRSESSVMQHSAGAQIEAEMERRSLLKLVPALGVGAVAPLDALSRMATTSAKGGPADAAVLGAAEDLTTTYAAAYDASPAHLLAAPVAAHLRRVRGYLHAATSGSRQRAAASVAQMAGFAGWLAFAAEDRAAAAAHFGLARDAAITAGDHVALASVLASTSDLHSVTHAPLSGDSARAVALIDQANDVLPDDAPAAIRSWLASRQAVEHAAVGNQHGFDHHIDRAWRHLDGPRSGGAGFFSDAGRFATWDDDLVRGFEVSGLLLLDRPLEAENILDAMPTSTAKFSQRQVTYLTRYATARVGQGDIGGATLLATQALGVARRVDYRLGISRLRGVAAALAPHAARPDVAEFSRTLAVA